MAITATPASPKQYSYLASLITQRDLTGLDALGIEQAVREGTLDKGSASGLIDLLLHSPRKPQTVVHEDGQEVGEGYYLQEDTVYKVVRAKSTGNLYAKALHSTEYGRASWDYAPGAMKHLAVSHRLTLDQAREMGTRLGACVICGKALTDPESVPNRRSKPMTAWKPPIEEVRRHLVQDNGWTDVEVNRFLTEMTDNGSVLLDTDGWTLAASEWLDRQPNDEEPDGPKYPHVTVELSGEDGNAFMIIGRVARALRRAGVADPIVKQFSDDATSGDYDNVIATAMKWVTVE